MCFKSALRQSRLQCLQLQGGGCQLSLDDEDEREQVEIDKNGYAKHVLTESTAVSGVTTSSGLTLVFQTTGTVADDQLILFKGTSNSKTVTVRTGFLGDWAVWDTGINDASATDGTLKDGNFNVMKNGFTGNDGCAFVFKVDSDTTNSIYYYINGELALAWEKVTTTFCAALIDALSTNGLSFIDNSDSTSSTLAMSGNVYYIASAVDSDTAKTLSAKPSTTTSTSTTVSEKSIVSLALSGLDDSKVYYNPAAMKTDLVVTATYSDNTTVTLSASEYTITKNTAGTGIVVTSTANTSVSKEYAGFVYTQAATTFVTTAFRTAWTEALKLESGKTLVASWVQTSKGSNNWNTANVDLISETTNHTQLATARYDHCIMPETFNLTDNKTSDWNWDNFGTDVTGATVICTVNCSDSAWYIHLDFYKDGTKTHYQYYDYKTALSSGDIYFAITGDADSTITIE
ncbi:MAG: hypothetical protein II811_03555 [Spirochaetaceae bacterium]|nr:hypothetical protein [Spirochaetaceae bacterium]